MNTVLSLYKKRGETPKEALERLRKERPELSRETLSYAGRLDPLAEGLLIVLAGDANKERENYLYLSKRYCFKVLFGWSTDTYDIAGKLVKTSDAHMEPLALMAQVAELPGEYVKPYPPFSSKPVEGKPLFRHAREGKLEGVIPEHTIEIASARLLKMDSISGTELGDLVSRSLESLTGDFRQSEIRACWEKHLRGTYRREYDMAAIEIACSSGTYVRQLAHELGEALGVPALALRIVRTAVGEFTLEGASAVGGAPANYP